MTKLQEIMNLTKLEESIIMFGKIEKVSDVDPLPDDHYFPCKRDEERLNKYRFYELQEKYKYGWYIAEESLEDQIRSIERFKLFIMNRDEEKPKSSELNMKELEDVYEYLKERADIYFANAHIESENDEFFNSVESNGAKMVLKDMKELIDEMNRV